MNIAEPAGKTEVAAENSLLPEWTSPQIVRIELKRTLLEAGSDIDGTLGSWTTIP